jgi:lipoprotein-releasing system ATP-binding protein
MQRAAIARALITGPRVLLADEPTGNLDEDTGRGIMALLHDLNRQEGLTIVMVTHNRDLAAGTDRVVRLTAGRVETPTTPLGIESVGPSVYSPLSTFGSKGPGG